jgi:hypothetical protein
MTSLQQQKHDYYMRNRVEILAKAKAKYQANTDKMKAYNLKFYYKNWEKIQKDRLNKK